MVRIIRITWIRSEQDHTSLDLIWGSKSEPREQLADHGVIG